MQQGKVGARDFSATRLDVGLTPCGPGGPGPWLGPRLSCLVGAQVFCGVVPRAVNLAGPGTWMLPGTDPIYLLYVSTQCMGVRGYMYPATDSGGPRKQK